MTQILHHRIALKLTGPLLVLGTSSSWPVLAPHGLGEKKPPWPRGKNTVFLVFFSEARGTQGGPGGPRGKPGGPQGALGTPSLASPGSPWPSLGAPGIQKKHRKNTCFFFETVTHSDKLAAAYC